MTQQLSPVAQAVLIAFLGDAENTGLEIDDMRENLASALRVAADQFFYDWNGMCCEEHLKSIADELEAQ